MPKPFSLSLSKAIDATMENAVLLYQAGCTKLFADIIEKTPVLTGFARSAWWQNVGAVGTGNIPKQGMGAYSAPILSPLQIKSLADKVFLANGAEYIELLEFGRSNKAPQGMVRVTLADAERYFA